MSRRGNYGFERWRRETAKRAKQEAKRQRRTDRAREGASGPEMGERPETGPPAGVWEWFSPSRNRTATSAPGARPASDAPDDWMLLTDVAETDQDDGSTEAGSDAEPAEGATPDERQR